MKIKESEHRTLIDWNDDPQDRAPMTEAIDTIADLRLQLENAKLSEQYAMQTVENLHKEVAELAAERDNWKEQVENPKMTYCAFCGKQYDIDDREKALEEIANHVTECEKHPYAALEAKLAALVEAAEEIVIGIEAWNNSVEAIFNSGRI